MQESEQGIPKTAILRKACLHSWLLAGINEPGFQESGCNNNWQELFILPKLFVQTVWFMFNTCISRLLVCSRQRCLYNKPNPIKTLGSKSLISFPGRHFTSGITIHCWRNLSVSCVTLLGGFWKLAPGFLHSAPYSFPFANYVSYPFTVISHSHIDYILGPGGPLRESQTWKGCEVPSTRSYKEISLLQVCKFFYLLKFILFRCNS